MICRRILILSVIAAVAIPLVAFALSPLLPGVVLTILAAIFWYIGILRSKNWGVHIAYTLNILAAVLVLYNAGSPILSLLAVLFSLAGWDLARFSPRVESISPPAAALELQRLHLRRLGLTLAAGFTAGLAAMLVQIELSFRSAVAIGLLTTILLALIAREVYRQKEDSANR